MVGILQFLKKFEPPEKAVPLCTWLTLGQLHCSKTSFSLIVLIPSQVLKLTQRAKG